MGKSSFKYEIVLIAVIGDRHGTLSADITDNRINGVIHVMDQDNHFSGTVDEKGNCNISGTIKTLLRNAEYTAEGFLDKSRITLSLDINGKKMIIAGTAADNGGNAT